uniref:Protein kinase domain-containing protein n=1 Tax=Ascaris lumbricoides TaxID=6252 RepID=A0A0M3I730_ASCLU
MVTVFRSDLAPATPRWDGLIIVLITKSNPYQLLLADLSDSQRVMSVMKYYSSTKLFASLYETMKTLEL